jgi:transcriptional regulator with XRE-family HTH domain
MLMKKRKRMAPVVDEAISFDDISLGMTARIQRALQRLTRQEVASMAGVGEKEVDIFESNQPLPSLAQLKLLSTYNIIIEANIVGLPS